MNAYYDILDKLKTLLIADNDVNTVTQGSLDDVALNKFTTYPLSHIIVNTASLVSNGIIRFNISIIAMDVVDTVKSTNSNLDDVSFRGIDNEMDVLNTQLSVLTRLMETLRRGQPYSDGYFLNNDVTLEPFTHRFEDKVAGWTCTVDIDVYHDMTVCDEEIVPVILSIVIALVAQGDPFAPPVYDLTIDPDTYESGDQVEVFASRLGDFTDQELVGTYDIVSADPFTELNVSGHSSNTTAAWRCRRKRGGNYSDYTLPGD